MGDRTPTQFFCDLKRITGTCNPHDDTITWLLKTEFLNRLPRNVQSILAAFDSHPLEETAKIGDSIIFSSPKQTPDTVSSQNRMSMLLQEMNNIKIELASLKQNFANTPSTLKPPGHRAQPSLAHTSARPPRSTQHYLSVSNPSINSNYNHSQQTPPGPNLILPGRNDLCNGQCFYHHRYSSNARYCIPGCTHYLTFKKPLNCQGGASM